MKRTSRVYQRLHISQIARGSCTLCGARSRDSLDLCGHCRAELPLNARACRLCAHPLPAAGAEICGNCLRRPPPFTAFAPFIYGQPLDRLILEFKFSDRLYLGRTLGALLAQALLAEEPGAAELIVPVPLHAARLRERGYNQAMELARPVGRRLGVPVQEAVQRIRATPGQAGLKAVERRRNVRGSFAVTAPSTVSGRRVAIVDDVFTTGATVTELAECLRRAGAASVTVWTVARTAGPG